jgi:hypothetical protein
MNPVGMTVLANTISSLLWPTGSELCR